MERVNERLAAAVGSALARFLPGETVQNIRPYLAYDKPTYLKQITDVSCASGRRFVVKLIHEDGGALEKERDKIERQSAFSEFLRQNSILTPRRYRADGAYCVLSAYGDRICCATVEDRGGEEIREISAALAHRIGALLARIHTLSLQSNYRIGCGTLFGAAVKNDVNAFDALRKLCGDPRLDAAAFSRIETLYGRRMDAIRSFWDTLPRAATQGDISINNLADTPNGLLVFDYNNAGDEVLVSDLVLEGLLTAYEMDLPNGVQRSERERLFPAFLEGYCTVRKLTDAERRAAWEIYALYDSLWFTKILHNDESLEKLTERGDVERANALLGQMERDLTRKDTGLFF